MNNNETTKIEEEMIQAQALMTLAGFAREDVECGNTITSIANILIRDNNTMKVYKLDNFKLVFRVSLNYIELVDMSGAYYDPDYGYIITSTNSPFRIYDNDPYPSQGWESIAASMSSRAFHRGVGPVVLPAA